MEQKNDSKAVGGKPDHFLRLQESCDRLEQDFNSKAKLANANVDKSAQSPGHMFLSLPLPLQTAPNAKDEPSKNDTDASKEADGGNSNSSEDPYKYFFNKMMEFMEAFTGDMRALQAGSATSENELAQIKEEPMRELQEDMDGWGTETDLSETEEAKAQEVNDEMQLRTD